MRSLPAAVSALAQRLTQLGWVSDLLVAGSLATGDYLPGVSDLDLVAVVDGPLDRAREAVLVGLHRELDRFAAVGAKLDVSTSRTASWMTRTPSTRHGRTVRWFAASCRG